MAEAELRVGAVVKTLDREEYRSGVRDLEKAMWESKQPPLTQRPSGDIVRVDGSGNLNPTGIFRCPVGMRVDVHRVEMGNPAYTPAAPLSGGWLAVGTSEAMVTYAGFVPRPGSTAILPATITWTGDAPVLTNGGRLYVAGAGLPANLVISTLVQVDLFTSEWPGAEIERELA